MICSLECFVVPPRNDVDTLCVMARNEAIQSLNIQNSMNLQR